MNSEGPKGEVISRDQVFIGKVMKCVKIKRNSFQNENGSHGSIETSATARSGVADVTFHYALRIREGPLSWYLAIIAHRQWRKTEKRF